VYISIIYVQSINTTYNTLNYVNVNVITTTSFGPAVGPSSGCALGLLSDYTWADHLILGLIFSQETIICGEVATEWDT
jgi:hypothetical protein